MFFGSNRAGSEGGLSDIYMTSREKLTGNNKCAMEVC